MDLDKSKTKSATISCSVDHAFRYELDRYCVNVQRSRHAVIREALTEYLEARGVIVR